MIADLRDPDEMPRLFVELKGLWRALVDGSVE